MEEQKKETTTSGSTNDATLKVTGIGGIFFFSDNPKETKEWYSQNLGLETHEKVKSERRNWLPDQG